MTKPLYFYNGTTFEQVGPTTPQSPIAYQTSAPTGPATGDLWIDSDGDVDTYNRQLTRYYFVATAAQTTITGTDANGLTLAYVAGSEMVHVNGSLLVRGQDYTATNGTSVVLSSALAVNDVVEIFAYTAFTVANAYTKAEIDSLRIGNIVQVVSGTTSTQVNSSSTTYADTGLTATITPKSASNKILVLVSQSYGKTNGNADNSLYHKLLRGATDLTTYINNAYTGNAIYFFGVHSQVYLDSPNTTSATIYKTQFRNGTAAAQVEVQSYSQTSTITLMEVAV
jgi:hypothetical protein